MNDREALNHAYDGGWLDAAANEGRVNLYAEIGSDFYNARRNACVSAAQPHLDICSATDDTMAGHPACDCGAEAPLQAGMANDRLRAEWDNKVPGVVPDERQLTAFALGAEAGFDHARNLEKTDWARFHSVMKKYDLHPGRTDDDLIEVLDRALQAAGEIRLEPRILQIGAYAVPEPLRRRPRLGEYVWSPMMEAGYPQRASGWRWTDNDAAREKLRQGFVHSTKEAAEAHALALLSFTEQTNA